MTMKKNTPKRVEVVNSDEFFEQFYIDGVQNVVFSAANCKVDIFQTVSREGDAEYRRIVKTLVLPTSSLVELCNNVLSSFDTNRDAMEQAFTQQRDRFVASLPKQSPDSDRS